MTVESESLGDALIARAFEIPRTHDQLRLKREAYITRGSTRRAA